MQAYKGAHLLNLGLEEKALALDVADREVQPNLWKFHLYCDMPEAEDLCDVVAP